MNRNSVAGQGVRILERMLLLLAFMLSGVAFAQSDSGPYPSKPVRLIIPFPPGGPTDTLGRLTGEMLAKELGQQFVAINVGGAGGAIGATQVAKSKPDGYTLMLGTIGTIVNNPNLSQEIGYDSLRDFQGISSLWSQPTFVMVRKDGPFRNLKELIAEAKKRPGELNYGSSGVGSGNHMSTELFASIAGIKMTHIPYKGVAPALADLMGRKVDVVLGPVANLVPNQERLAGLVISSPRRSAFAPGIPTAAEAGLPAFIYNSWGGLFSPSGVSPAVAGKLRESVVKSLAVEANRKRFTDLGVDPEPSSSSTEYQAEITAYFKQGKELIEAMGLYKKE